MAVLSPFTLRLLSDPDGHEVFLSRILPLHYPGSEAMTHCTVPAQAYASHCVPLLRDRRPSSTILEFVTASCMA